MKKMVRATSPAFLKNLKPFMSALEVALVLLTVIGQPAQAQTYSVLHTFIGGPDGAAPSAGLTRDAAGDFYGTAQYGGYTQGQNCSPYGCGTVFKLVRQNSGWILTPLYNFHGGTDSAWPAARVVIGPDGTLYGTTTGGAGNSCSNNGCGTVFNLRPPTTLCTAALCPWTEAVLYRFAGAPDGQIPGPGDLVFDPAGNIYGTTLAGGTAGWGTVYKLTHSNVSWTETILYNFTGQRDGGNPNGVVFDNSGNLYGTTRLGGYVDPPEYSGAGVIFKLTLSDSDWTESVLYTFMGEADGALPYAGLTMDNTGTFYGTTYAGGGGLCLSGYYQGCGTVFRGPEYTVVYAFSAYQRDGLPEGPMAPATLDAAGDIYGTTWSDGAYGAGNVFELTATYYAYTSLYDFTGSSDGGYPASNVVFDSNGNLYGTTSGGGNGHGVIWQITP